MADFFLEQNAAVAKVYERFIPEPPGTVSMMPLDVEVKVFWFVIAKRLATRLYAEYFEKSVLEYSRCLGYTLITN